ncbi:hypothetical protein chiPu_0033593 [Chiloscyllium punctatum]|uniref:Uncharacterized protein n=1 Tax=Chiloscyllium punctatum TaxID=137246 RepID=A0A401U2Q7_CHIPU|nr:hypothetical protein [Chiloscyllium punctatum]
MGRLVRRETVSRWRFVAVVRLCPGGWAPGSGSHVQRSATSSGSSPQDGRHRNYIPPPPRSQITSPPPSSPPEKESAKPSVEAGRKATAAGRTVP